ncbi:MAG: hypothetical protein A2W31_06960 [Planctomycetes bacterium RBG_16_64_10]|nr:MAG: hypothetical protein A2W31_06960 [Planctomycetes bacterium RBG_16_64_10]
MALDLAQLVREHHAVVYRYAYRLSGSAADAEDLTQQVFLVVQQKLDQLRDEHKVRSWLFAILRNCFLMTRRHRQPVLAGDLAIDLTSLPELPDETDDEPIDLARLQMALDAVPDELKLVLMMFYFEQQSYRQIAEALAIPMGTVMSRLSRAKGYLRRQLLPVEIQGGRPTPLSGR